MPGQYTNISMISSGNSTLGLFKSAMIATDGLLGIIMIVVIFMAIVLLLNRMEYHKSITAASFACFILSSYLAYAGLITVMAPIFFSIVMGGMILYMVTTEQR